MKQPLAKHRTWWYTLSVGDKQRVKVFDTPVDKFTAEARIGAENNSVFKVWPFRGEDCNDIRTKK
jgi:hypothetical protein